MTIERTIQGYRISTIHNGYRISKLYIGFTKTEARKHFQAHLKTL